jgi:hypothetical protein
MDLKESLRRDRDRGQAKSPLAPDLFSQVGGLVRRHRLGEAFCRLMATMSQARAEALARACGSHAKPLYEASLFFLATPEEYQVIDQILSELANPYLAWARSPEEILLSRPLWRRRPGLDPETLNCRHLAALW